MPSELTNISHISVTMYVGESAHWSRVKCFSELTGSKKYVLLFVQAHMFIA
jgi:hypothetical protein